MRIFASRRPECRLCTHVLCGCRWGACGMCYVCCIGEAVWCWLYSSHDGPAVLSSPTSISITKERRRQHIYLSRAIWMRDLRAIPSTYGM